MTNAAAELLLLRDIAAKTLECIISDMLIELILTAEAWDADETEDKEICMVEALAVVMEELEVVILLLGNE